MKTYDWILFDADDTLFNFDAFSGLKVVFANYGIEFTKNHYNKYEKINKPLWIDYQNGKITAEQVQVLRFDNWAKKLNVPPQQINSHFMTAMAEICTPLEGAKSLLNALKGKAKLGIVTNGFAELQQKRLEHTGLNTHFELVVISEQIGVAKPHIDFFEHALSAMGKPSRDKVLMVGDNPDSDILGGIKAGLDTCWLNINKRATPKNIIPTYQVRSLKELEDLLVPSYAY